MNYIKIIGWEKFQHYKHRNPPWIKLHTSLLDNEEFECLQDASKLLLICLWLFAARKGNGEIPANISYLQKKLPVRKPIKLQPLIDAGFIECYQNDSGSLATCYTRDRAETETETETEISMSIFDQARKIYPGSKRGNRTEFFYFKACHNDWKEILKFLKAAIETQIAWREAAATGEFRPPWKNFKTWIYNKCWEEEMPAPQNNNDVSFTAADFAASERAIDKRDRLKREAEAQGNR